MANFVILWDHHAMRISPYTLHLRKERGLSVSLITHFAVIQTKTCGSLVSTLSKTSYDKTAARKRWSLSKSIFLDVETTFRHIFPSSNLEFSPLGDPTNICANTRIRSLTTNSWNSSSYALTTVKKFQSDQRSSPDKTYSRIDILRLTAVILALIW